MSSKWDINIKNRMKLTDDGKKRNKQNKQKDESKREGKRELQGKRVTTNAQHGGEQTSTYSMNSLRSLKNGCLAWWNAHKRNACKVAVQFKGN